MPKLPFTPLYLHILSVVIALIVFFYPGFATENKNLELTRRIIGFVILFIPLLIPITLWSWNAISVLFQRVYYYPQLHQHAQRYKNELNDTARFVFNYIKNDINARTFEITAARYDRKKLYIVLKKRKSHELVMGNILVAWDTQDELIMGQFEIVEIREVEYYACGIRNINPIWLSYVMQQGESHIIPHIVAIYMPLGEK